MVGVPVFVRSGFVVLVGAVVCLFGFWKMSII